MCSVRAAPGLCGCRYFFEVVVSWYINSSDLKNFTLSAKEILEIKGMAAGLLVAAETLSAFC